MKRMGTILVLGGCLLLLAGTSGCRLYTTFNPYPRISVLDFTADPRVAGRIAPESLMQLKQAAVRHIQATGKFQEVAEGRAGGMETVFVEPIVHAYRRHKMGTKALQFFTGVDVRGESLIHYRFFDSTGRTLLYQRIHSRYRVVRGGVDPTAEEAAWQLSRVVSWHKNIPPPPH